MTIKINKIVVNSDVIITIKKDKERIHTICEALRKVFLPLGYQVIESGVGANYHYSDSTTRKNAYVINIVGGLCAGTIKEYSASYFQNAMKKNGSIGAQPFYSGGLPKTNKWRTTPFEKITWLPRSHDDNFSPSSFKGIDYPVKWMEKANFDWCQEETVDKLIPAIVKMTATRFYKEGIKTDESLVPDDLKKTTPSPTDKDTDSDDSDKDTDTDTDTDKDKDTDKDTDSTTTTTKKLQSRLIEKVYTHPYYNQNIGIVTTDKNGAFTKKTAPPYNGKYKVNYHYGGSRNYTPTNKYITLEFHGGAYFKATLLETKITDTYTDNTTKITTTGKIPSGTKHTRTDTTTIQYKDGVETSKTTTTRINDDYNTIFKNDDTDSTTTNTDTDTGSDSTNDSTDDTNKKTDTTTDTTSDKDTTTTTYDTGKETVLTKSIPLKNNQPDITKLGSDYKMADNNATYTITSREILRVQTLDSLCQQKHGYVPKYTFFRAYGSNTKYVIERSKWNVIARALNQYHVQKGYNAVSPPYALKVSLKNKTRAYPIFYDRQDTGYTCGPTSMSIIMQGLNFYRSERFLAGTFGTTESAGTSESSIINNASKVNMKVTDIADTKDGVKNALQQGAMILWHITGHFMSVVAYDSSSDKFLCQNPSGLHNIARAGWLTWTQMCNTDSLKDKGFQKVTPQWTTQNNIVQLNNLLPRIADIQFNYTQITNYYTNMGGRYTAPLNNQMNTQNTEGATYYTEETDIPGNKKDTNTQPTKITVSKTAQSPYLHYLPTTKTNKPKLEYWKHPNESYRWAYTGNYVYGKFTIPKKYYQEVFTRDAKTMQINNMQMSRWTMFKTGEKDEEDKLIQYVIPRERWNVIEKAIYYSLVFGKGDKYSVSLPESITINLNGTHTFGDGKRINLKGMKCNYWYCGNHQDDGHSCGPTSFSIISQYMHNFVGEWNVQHTHGLTAQGGSVRYMNLPNIKGHNTGNTNAQSQAVAQLKKGHPILWHGNNHFTVVHDISDDYTKFNVTNPTSNDIRWKPKSGWVTWDYLKGCVNYSSGDRSHNWYEPNYNLSESEKTQLTHLLYNLGGSWRRTQNFKEWLHYDPNNSGTGHHIWNQ